MVLPLNAVYRPIPDLALSATVPLVHKVIRTGRHDARASDGSLVDPLGQLGTGGWGPFAGLHYRLEQGDWLGVSVEDSSLDGLASVSCRVRTQATYFDHSRCKFGDAALWSVHGQYRPVQRLALDLRALARARLAPTRPGLV